ncbi:hypothetical protein C8R47DRAFT_1066877 [Mycena vitilis]|nr:hypothetical protein C8R47DRAFT_1066877 [Mycena vitilis]
MEAVLRWVLPAQACTSLLIPVSFPQGGLILPPQHSFAGKSYCPSTSHGHIRLQQHWFLALAGKSDCHQHLSGLRPDPTATADSTAMAQLAFRGRIRLRICITHWRADPTVRHQSFPAVVFDRDTDSSVVAYVQVVNLGANAIPVYLSWVSRVICSGGLFWWPRCAHYSLFHYGSGYYLTVETQALLYEASIPCVAWKHQLASHNLISVLTYYLGARTTVLSSSFRTTIDSGSDTCCRCLMQQAPLAIVGSSFSYTTSTCTSPSESNTTPIVDRDEQVGHVEVQCGQIDGRCMHVNSCHSRGLETEAVPRLHVPSCANAETGRLQLEAVVIGVYITA